ncbi:MAG TPA: NUDIX domain-containing protein [Fimbriimonadaceae bacterium]|nr:NUDIX domain-containing protein [Fimbriimonadaceae bacterium]
MLQQTGVSTVIPYFERWIARFPDVHALAVADEQEALSIWQGLGYYRRCRNLLAGARVIAADAWPGDAKAWQRIPGVGRYTAAAIASIALGEPVPVVDGNVERVYARLTGDPSSAAELTRRAWDWAGRELRQENPGDWNQALMELGATVCTPTSPKCAACPLASNCMARKQGCVDRLPTPSPKPETIYLEFDVAIVTNRGRFGLRQIPAGEWWEGMWEFPRFPKGSLCGRQLAVHKHTVTNHRITLHPVMASLRDVDVEFRWFSAEEIEEAPLPAPQRAILHRLAANARRLVP